MEYVLRLESDLLIKRIVINIFTVDRFNKPQNQFSVE